MPTITIFTPTYNRAHTIRRTYESLCRQTNHDFMWLIIDDGSTDSTRDLVKSWLKEIYQCGNRIEGVSIIAPWLSISYVFQNNQGMHGAHNTAYDNITTELNTCIDSDDFMPDDAVAKIVEFWQNQPEDRKRRYAGLIGLDIDDKTHEIIGTPFPADMPTVTLSKFYNNGGRGDKKLVYRTDVIKKTPPYPIFEGERYVGLAYKYKLIDQEYELLTLNEPLVVVDYQIDGSSSSMYKQYWNNPKGWSFYRKFEMVHSTSLKRKFKVCIHYVSSSLISKNRNFIKESPSKFTTICAVPFGVLLYLKIKHSVKHNLKRNISK